MIYFFGYDSSAIAALYVQMYVLMNASMYICKYVLIQVIKLITWKLS